MYCSSLCKSTDKIWANMKQRVRRHLWLSYPLHNMKCFNQFKQLVCLLYIHSPLYPIHTHCKAKLMYSRCLRMLQRLDRYPFVFGNLNFRWVVWVLGGVVEITQWNYDLKIKINRTIGTGTIRSRNFVAS